MANDIVLSAALRSTITSISRTQLALDRTSLRIATGREVNSALDNPQNFFAAQALSNEARDFSRLLDGISQSVRTVQEALIGVQAISRLLDQSEAVAVDIQERLRAGLPVEGNETASFNVSPTSLPAQIAALNPAAYFRLNDAAGPSAADSGAAGNNATYQGGVAPGAQALYNNGGGTAADFGGVNGVVIVPDHAQINLSPMAQRTVELMFNADDVTTRQVLYEEGGTVNSLALYIDNGRLYVAGRDTGDWAGSFSTPIAAGQTYHVAFVFDQPTDSLTGYLNGVSFGSVTVDNAVFPAHSGDVAIGALQGSAWLHDGLVSGNGLYFNGRISDVAIHNSALSQAELQNHVAALDTVNRLETTNATFEELMIQINTLVEDAHYRGINLLEGDKLITRFNAEGSTYLLTEGVDFTAEGLGLLRYNFDNIEDIDEILASIREAQGRVENFSFALSGDLGIITSRQDFTQSHIVTHEAGSDDLTVADLNEEGANMLAVQTRQQLGVTAMSLAGQTQASILDIFTGSA